MEYLISNSGLYFLSRLEHLYLLGTARASKYGDVDSFISPHVDARALSPN